MNRILVVVALWCSGVAMAMQAPTWSVAAKTAYDQGQYAEAARLYDSVLSAGVISPATHYNLGNSYYRMGEIGACILHYEKALRLDPDNADILTNLQLANLRTTDRVQAANPTMVGAAWRQWLLSLSLANWSALALVVLIMSALLLGWFVYRWKQQPMPSVFITGLVGLGIGILLSLFAWQRYLMIHPRHEEAIVLSPNVYVKASPDEESTDLFIIHEGLKVTIQEQEEGWIRIAVDGDKVGWVPTGDMGVI